MSRVCIAFVVVALLGFTLPLSLFLLVCIAYMLWRPGYELIVLGVCIDAQFGQGIGAFAYEYTLSIAFLVLVLGLVKPHLALYQ